MNLPIIDSSERTRYTAVVIANDTLNRHNDLHDDNFTRSTARAERERIATLSLTKVGGAALVQFYLDDTYAHVEGLS